MGVAKDLPLSMQFQQDAAIRALDGGTMPKPLLGVTVDADGRGDYTSIKAACDYLAGETAPTDPITGTALTRYIFVNPGAYYERKFTVPDRVMVQGITQGIARNLNPASLPFVFFKDDSSGDMVTLGSHSSLVNLQLWFLAIQAGSIDNLLSGTVRVVYYAGAGTTSYSELNNVMITIQSTTATTSSARICGVYAEGGANSYLQLSRCHVISKANPGTHMKYIEVNAGTVGVWDSWLNSNKPGLTQDIPTGGEASGSGELRFYNSFLGSYGSDVGGFTNELVQSGSGVVKVRSTPYDNASGTITTITGSGGGN